MAKKGDRKEKKGGDVSKRASERVSIRRFALTYLILMGAFFFIIGYTPLQRIIDINGLYTRGVVILTTGVLHVLNIPSSSQGSIINLPGIALDVRFGCNGLEAVMIYSVAVIAFPSSWRKRLYGILAGFIVIQVINILRIAGLAYAGIHLRGLFEYIHIYVAQGMMIAISLGIFFFYIVYAKADEKAAA